MSPASEKSDLQYTSGAMYIGDPHMVRSSKRISVSTALYTNVREELQIVRIIFSLQAEISYHELITGEGSGFIISVLYKEVTRSHHDRD